jgi:hypothetical protein
MEEKECQLAEYIRKSIASHFEDYRIRAPKKTIDEMVVQALGGILAFQIIYSDIRHSLFEYRLEKYKALDYRKVLHSKDICREHQTYSDLRLWSYDSGLRFQWSESETIKLDAALIREIKLSQII